MAQIQKGTTYSTGDQVTAANLNALADAAILLPGAITDQTAKTVPLAADTILLHSAADTALRKSTLTQLFSNATGIPISTGISGLGTGIATALAINTGTTGAPALLGSAGAFTTLSATGVASFLGLKAQKATATSGFISAIDEGANVYNVLGSRNNADSAYLPMVIRGTTVTLGATSDIATITSTGLAVTGALSSTSDITIGASGNLFLAGNFAKYIRANTGSSADLRLGGWNGVNIEVGSGFTNVASFSSTGLAVTGTSTSSGSMRITTNNVYYRGTTSGGAQQIILGIGADDNTAIVSKSGNTIKMDAGGSTVGTFSSTGLAVTGALSCTGALSKGSGSFRIEHPLPAKSATHQLVHSFIEGPQADLIYRGKVTLIDGKASVNIDAAATMTDGTFEVLCRDVQCFTTNETGWTAVRGKVTGNILIIEAKDVDCTDEISWMVIGERQDPHMMETDWTDNNGKVIVEPLKPSIKSN